MLNQDELMIEVYNLILETNTRSSERELLVLFKDKVSQQVALELALRDLLEGLRQEAVRLLRQGKSLSPKVSQFYLAHANLGQKETQLARGLASYGIFGGK